MTIDNNITENTSKELKIETLKCLVKYLYAIGEVLSTYYGIIKRNNNTIFSLGKDPSKEVLAKKQKLNDTLTKPLEKILDGLEYGRPKEENLIYTIYHIIGALTDDFLSNNNSFVNEFFSDGEKRIINEKLRKIKNQCIKFVYPSDEYHSCLLKLKKNLPSANKKTPSLRSIISASSYPYDLIMQLLSSIMYEDFYDKDEHSEIREETRNKYSLQRIKEIDNEKNFFEEYDYLYYSTKKQFNIENINIEEYKRLLVKKEMLEKIQAGLNEILDIISKNCSSWLDINKLQAQKIEDLIVSFLPTIKKMLDDTNKKIAKYEQYKETVSKAYLIETELVYELAELMYKARIEEPYNKSRYEELISIVKDENYKKAQEIANKLYQEYLDKKETEETKERSDYKPYSKYSYLYLQPTTHLEYRLKSLAGEDAIRLAKERAEIDANSKYPVIPDHRREPFDSSPDENAGKRNKVIEEYYRNNLIEKIKVEEEKKEKERIKEEERLAKKKAKKEEEEREAQELAAQKNTTSNNQHNIIEKELLELVEEMLKKITVGRPSDYYMYGLKEYPEYLPNINIEKLYKSRKYLYCIFTFLTEDEINEVEKDLERRIAEYLDFYYSVVPEYDLNTDPREIAETKMFKELFAIACVEKVREKYKKLTKGYSND